MNGVTVIKRTVVVRKGGAHNVTLIRHPNIIKVTAQVPIIHKQAFKPFSFIVSNQGQGVFTLPSYALDNGMMFFSINGTLQDPVAGDYTVIGNQLTVGAGMDVGDHLYGMYEEE